MIGIVVYQALDIFYTHRSVTFYFLSWKMKFNKNYGWFMCDNNFHLYVASQPSFS